MNRPALFRLNFATSVDRIAEHVEHATESSLTDGNADRSPGIEHVHAANHSVRGTECDAANSSAAEVLLHFTGYLDLETLYFGLNLHGVVNTGKMGVGKFCVKRRSDDLRDMANVCGGRHIYGL